MSRSRHSVLAAGGLVALAACAPADAPANAAALGAATDDDGDPAVVAITYASDPARLRCTGTLVAPRVVLTAAHCGAQDDPSAFEVLAGSDLASGTRTAILEAVAHPSFDDTADHDLALLLLAAPVAAAPIELASEPPMPGPARLVGFGLTAPDAADDDRKRQGTGLVTEVMPLHLALAADPSLPCHGDSGGPVLVTGSSGERLAAVVSRGDPACSAAGFATRVDAQLDAFVLPGLAAWAEGSVALGDPCLYDEHCASGLCAEALDDPSLRFCGTACAGDDGCDAPLACAAGLCRHPLPSPGAVGAACATDADCARGECLAEDAICSVRCVSGAGDCPDGFACTHLGGVDFYCTPAPASSAGCEVAGARPSRLALLVALLAGAALATRRR